MLTSKKKFSIVTSVIAEGKNKQVSNRVTARAKVWVCGRSIAVIAGSNPAGCMDACIFRLLCVVM